MSSGGILVLMEGAPASAFCRAEIPLLRSKGRNKGVPDQEPASNAFLLFLVGSAFASACPRMERGRVREEQCDVQLPWESVRVVSEN